METARDVPQPSIAVRVGDLDRHACVVSLIEHHLQGRLSREDLERRQQLATSAVTTDDLRVLLEDLPQSPVTPAPARGRRVSVSFAGRVPGAVWALAPILPVYGAAKFGKFMFEYSAEGHYYTAAVAGAVGYVTHSVTTFLRR